MFSAGAAASGDLEFRSDDNAWYNVTVKLEGDVLRISYSEFAGEHDNVFTANHFRSLSELSDFEGRFRPLSRQLQDYECPNIDPGMPVCASYSSRADDVRFYDALVEGVRSFTLHFSCCLNLEFIAGKLPVDFPLVSGIFCCFAILKILDGLKLVICHRIV